MTKTYVFEWDATLKELDAIYELVEKLQSLPQVYIDLYLWHDKDKLGHLSLIVNHIENPDILELRESPSSFKWVEVHNIEKYKEELLNSQTDLLYSNNSVDHFLENLWQTARVNDRDRSDL